MNQIAQKYLSTGEISPIFKSGVPFLIEGCLLLQCISGKASFKMNFKNYTISKSELAIFFNHMVIELEDKSDDFIIRYINIPEEKAYDICVTVTSEVIWKTLYLNPVLKIQKIYQRLVNTFFYDCIFVNRNCSENTSEFVLQNLVMSFLMVMNDIFSKNNTKENQIKLTPQWKIIGEFLVLLSRNYTQHHNVLFYADSLNITPDYLSVVVKRGLNLTPKEIIEEKLVLAIKAKLENSEMSVKEISNLFNYDNPPHLARVFRRHTGLSPTDYRRSKRQNIY